MFIAKRKYIEEKNNFINKIELLESEKRELNLKLVDKNKYAKDLEKEIESKNKNLKEKEDLIEKSNKNQEQLQKENHNFKISIGLYKRNKTKASKEKKEFLKIISDYKDIITKLENEIKSLKKKPTLEELKFSNLKIDKKKYKGFKSNSEK